jgi:hypothetical protein
VVLIQNTKQTAKDITGLMAVMILALFLRQYCHCRVFRRGFFATSVLNFKQLA